MAENHIKIALKTINGDISNEKYKYNNEKPTVKNLKDFFIKGFQLDWVYLPHCQRMKDKFNKYKIYNDNLDLREHGPIIIVNEEKILDDVDEFVNQLKTDPYFTSLGIDRVFLRLLRIYPEFCRKKAKEEFFNWITNEHSKKYVEELFSLNWITKRCSKKYGEQPFNSDMHNKTEEKIDSIIEKIVKDN